MFERDALTEINETLIPEGQRIVAKIIARSECLKAEAAKKTKWAEMARKVDELHKGFAEELRKAKYAIGVDLATGDDYSKWWTPAVEQQKETDMIEEQQEAGRDAYPVQEAGQVLMGLEALETQIITLRNRLGALLRPRPSIQVPGDALAKDDPDNRSELMRMLKRVPFKVSDLDNMVQLIIEDLDL